MKVTMGAGRAEEFVGAKRSVKYRLHGCSVGAVMLDYDEEIIRSAKQLPRVFHRWNSSANCSR
jgi:hypothetical protein